MTDKPETTKTPTRKNITIKAYKEFTPEEIAAAQKKNKAFALEMASYNARALRGDFDTY